MSDYERPNDYFSLQRDNLFRLICDKQGINILDIGCGVGRLGSRLKQLGNAVYGIEINSEAATAAASVLDRVCCGDVEKMELDYPEGFFQVMIMGDILEHLIAPWNTLKRLRSYLADNGIIVASLPNIQYFPILFGLLLGRFQYTSQGILDWSHLRFFTTREAKRLFQLAGYEILDMPFILPYKKRWVRILSVVLHYLSFGLARNYLIGQIFIVATKRDMSIGDKSGSE